MASTNDRTVAVVGGGISGLSAAWLLQKSGARVTLFEKESRWGGHSFTDESPGVPIDLGFQVYNLTTYPNLVGLFEALDVDTEESEMSFALSMDNGALEWGSHGLGTIFAQRRNLLKPSFWRMVADVIRFGRQAPQVLEPAYAHIYKGMTLREYLKRHRYSLSFQHNYLLPMCAAVWSVPNRQVMAFPVVMLVRFWANHHLLDLIQRPVWRVVKGRSRTYVSAILADLEDIRSNAEVVRVVPSTPLTPLSVELADGSSEEFDAIILATHSDTSLQLLEHNAPEGVRDILSAIPYNKNDIWVHSDTALMPSNRATWASWNFMGRTGEDDAAVCVTYWVNRLQTLPEGAPNIFVTLNPLTSPAADKVHRRLSLAHPVYGISTYKAQAKLPYVQGKGDIYYAGAWCGYGFHEDGLNAGIAAAEALGARILWQPRATSPKISMLDRLCIAMFDRFARLALKVGHLRLILPSGQELSYGSPDNVKTAAGESWRGLPLQKATVRIFDCAFFRKIIMRHDTGLGESYMDNDYEVEDLGALLAVLTANAGNIQSNRGKLGLLNWVGDKLLLLSHLGRSNTLAGSRRNIEEHYDAGNDMYRLFLDPSMTYSCGIHRPGESLEQAQMNKLDALIGMADLRATDNVLEIGCGWGSLAIRAVQASGCRWTGLTLSKEQLEEASKRVKAAGLSDRITLMFCDYRDCPGAGSYSKVLSCEMIEAVGQEHLVSYFRTIGAMLRPGGTAVIQAIAEPDERYEAYCASSDFIREHVFPGGHLPSMGAMVEAARGTGLSPTSVSDIGPDYAVTLRAWRDAWERRRDQILALGYSQRFWRKFRFYFAYCEAAFDAKYIHDYQITWHKATEPVANLPMTAEAAPLTALPNVKPEPADPVTQILLAVYFFLAGIAVGHSHLLWVMPLASAFYGALRTLTALLAPTCNHAYRKLAPESQAWWCSNVVHLVHSAATFLAAAVHIMRQPSSLLINRGMQRNSNATLLPDLLVCISAGFFGFQLFTLVHQRLFRRVYKVVLHFTVLLVLFGSAAYKAEHTPLLACTLLSEISSVFYLLAKLQDFGGQPAGSSARRLVSQAELASTLVFRALPHAFIGASVLLNPFAFSAKGYFATALIGSLYINITNVRRVMVLLRLQSPSKIHVA